MIECGTFHIGKWTEWDNDIAKAISEFVELNDIAPNYLVASRHSYDQIEFVINIVPGSYKNVVEISEDGQLQFLTEEDRFQINGFEMGDVILDFQINEDESTERSTFYLLYTKSDESF